MKSLDSIMSQGERHSLSLEKQELLDLEAEGKYVFHGSDTEFESAEPRQAIDERGTDRDPAVFASSKADVAIFYAIYRFKMFPEVVARTGTIVHDDGSVELEFGLPQATIDAIPESSLGWVYVFDKRDFSLIGERGGIEYEATDPAIPIKKIKVAKRDLPIIKISEE